MISITELLSTTTFRIITKVAFGSELTRQERLQFGDHTNGLSGEIDFVGYPVRQALTMFWGPEAFVREQEKSGPILQYVH